MRRTFKNDLLEEQFQEVGYIKVPFLNSEEIEQLKQAYFNSLNKSGGHLGPEDEKFKSKEEITYDFTFIDKNIAYKQEVFEIISSAFKNKSDEFLDNYQPIIANFIRKKEKGGEVPLHQNWAFVDEHKCTSVSIWCPLVDSNKENGTLEIVPKSHKRFGEVRGPMIRSELLDINQEIIDSKWMLPIETKAGEAVILDDSIVHYSSPNQTEGLRLAIQLILIPKEEKSIHFHMDHSKSRETVETLEADRDFYMSFNPWKKPSDQIKRVNSFRYQPFSLTIEEFEKRLGKQRFDENVASSWWSTFKKRLTINNSINPK
ncbi:MAG: phytanoyl-CoA dioxygenase family protein [Flavobacteriales bacterium]|nr:phytanoyl-CoA dioxygenase family protein [Flavobacteriales bacterium]